MKNKTQKICLAGLFILILIIPFVISAIDVQFSDSSGDFETLQIDKNLKKTPIKLECVDSDGKDFFNKGIVAFGNDEKEDFCKEDFVIEYFCDTKIKSIKQKCEKGCVDGACVGSSRITGEIILILDCEDGTKNNECSLEDIGKKCIEGNLVNRQECKNTEIEEIIYIYSGKELLAKKIDGELNFVHNDYLGSLRALTDSVGNLIKKSDFYAFGKPLNNDSDKYSDKELDDKLGLYYYGARYYDANLGRFISRDSVETEVSPYEGLGSNPLKYVDPDGNEIKGNLNSFKKLYPKAWKNIVASKLYQRVDKMEDVTLTFDTGPYINDAVEDVFSAAVPGRIRLAFTNTFEYKDKDGFFTYTSYTYFNPVLSSPNYLKNRIKQYVAKYGKRRGTDLATKHTDIELELTANHEILRTLYARQAGPCTFEEGTFEYDLYTAKSNLWTRQHDLEKAEEKLSNTKDRNTKLIVKHFIKLYESEIKEYENQIKTLENPKNEG